VATRGAHHGQRDPGIAGRCLNDSLPGLKLASPGGVVDYGNGQTILDLGHGIEKFQFSEQLDMVGRKAIEPHHRGTTNRLKDIVINHFDGLVLKSCDIEHNIP